MDPKQLSQWTDTLIKYLIENGPKLAGAVAILIVGFLVARGVGQVLGRWLNKKDLEPPIRMLITRITRLFIIAFALVIALGTCGINIAPLVAMLGVAGVGIGLAMQGVLGNLVSGLVIIFTKPFRVGEFVEIIGVSGQVSVIELFSTILVHPDRSRVVIPNRKIVGEGPSQLRHHPPAQHPDRSGLRHESARCNFPHPIGARPKHEGLERSRARRECQFLWRLRH